MREVLLLEGKLHHASFVFLPGRYFIRGLLQLFNLHDNGAARAGGVQGPGAGAGSGRKRGGVYDGGMNSWRTWVGVERIWGKGGGYGGERTISLSFSFVKQRPSRTRLEDASLTAIGGLCMEAGAF